MQKLFIYGRIFGKNSQQPRKDETRAILPLGAVLSLMDAILTILLTPVANSLASADSRIFLGALPKAQPLQIMHTCHLVIEKGMDRKFEGCLGQADIKKFFDRLRCTVPADNLSNHGVDLGVIGAFLRFHTCTRLFLSIDCACFEVEGRCTGVLTGSRSSVVLSRLPVQDAFNKCLETWSDLGFELEHTRLCACSWIDNIFSFGPNPAHCTTILNGLEAVLKSDWDLRFSGDSKSFMVCKGHPDTGTAIGGWKETYSFKGLGHLISNDGSADTCWQSVRVSMWVSFRSNSGAFINRRDVSAKITLLNRVTRPKLEFTCTRWPSTRKLAEAIDHTQRRMLALCLSLRRSAGQTDSQYFRQRDQLVGALIKTHGRWSHTWCNQLLNWYDHLKRDRNSSDLPGPVFSVQDTHWLQMMRIPFVSSTRSLFAGGTGTRLLAEAPKIRWEDSTDRALEWLQR